jgi:Tfp pilus assembly protein PilF
MFLTMLAEAQALDGDVDGAFESLEEALGICPPERQYRPHTLTCRGEIAAAAGDVERAEASFREAIATAELMGAVSCKRRATAGLAALRGA